MFYAGVSEASHFAIFLYPSSANSRIVLERFRQLGVFAIGSIYLGFLRDQSSLVYEVFSVFCIGVWRAIRKAMTRV